MCIYVYGDRLLIIWLFQIQLLGSLQHEAVNRKVKAHRFIGDRVIYI